MAVKVSKDISSEITSQIHSPQTHVLVYSHGIHNSCNKVVKRIVKFQILHFVEYFFCYNSQDLTWQSVGNYKFAIVS